MNPARRREEPGKENVMKPERIQFLLQRLKERSKSLIGCLRNLVNRIVDAVKGVLRDFFGCRSDD